MRQRDGVQILKLLILKRFLRNLDTVLPCPIQRWMEKLRGYPGGIRGGSAPTNQSAGPVRFPTVVVVVFPGVFACGSFRVFRSALVGDTDGDGGSELLDGDLPVGSSLP